MAKRRTAAELQAEADRLGEQLKKVKREANKARKLEEAERTRIQLEKDKQDALELMQIAQELKLADGSTFYFYLVQERNKRKQQECVK